MIVSERLPREELLEWALLLRERGWPVGQIAEELCISRSYASALLNDRDGEKDKARRRSYAGTCERCGARTDGSNGRARAPKLCRRCTQQKQHEERYWTPETIVAAFREFAETMGRAPAVVDVMVKNGGTPSIARKLSAARIEEADRAAALGLRLPSPALVGREFEGGWRAALRVAGLRENASGGAGHRHRQRLQRLQEPRVVSARPVTTATPSELYRSFQRGEFVCPSCGEFTTVLYERTGWCGACTRRESRAA